jgi:hypothetical protein
MNEKNLLIKSSTHDLEKKKKKTLAKSTVSCFLVLACLPYPGSGQSSKHLCHPGVHSHTLSNEALNLESLRKDPLLPLPSSLFLSWIVHQP